MQKPTSLTFQKQLSAQQQSLSLPEAYNACQSIVRHHSKSFYVATMLLPQTKRRAIRVLYAFCRHSDDLVDEAPTNPRATFERWVMNSQLNTPTHTNPILLAWQDLHTRYALPDCVVNDLLEGIRMDLSVDRYATFTDLELYCYQVAGTVGLLSMQIIGYQPGADAYAIKLGLALQLTNILRDVGEDAQRGRVYLPLDELKAYDLTVDELLATCSDLHWRTKLAQDTRWHKLMRFQIQRARQLYQEAWPGIALLNADGRYAVAAAAMLYQGILAKVEANQYDNFSKRAFVSNREKFSMLPRIWWQTHQLKGNDR